MEQNYNVDDPRAIAGDDGEDIVENPYGEEENTSDLDILDSQWIRSAFMIPGNELEDVDKLNRYWSSANAKFTDTSMGGNIGVNARPQFTRYADVRDPGRLENRNKVSISSITGNYGMGTYYSEAIDDNSETIYLEFGVPKFNSLTRFFDIALDPNAASLANTGRVSIGATIGTVVGTFLQLTAFPVLSIIYHVIGVASKLLTVSSSSYYSLKPTMFMYWSTVNNLVSSMSVDLGIVQAGLSDDGNTKLGPPMKVDEEDRAHMANIFPEVYGESGFVDVFAIANRAQRLANQQTKQEYDEASKGTALDYEGYLKKSYYDKVRKPDEVTFVDYVSNAVMSFTEEYTKDTPVEPGENKKLEGDASVDEDAEKDNYGNYKIKQSWVDQMISYGLATVKEGASFAVFKVDYVGTVTESFSTSVKDSAIQATLNSTSAGARDIKFNLAGGNIMDNPLADAIGWLADTAVSGLKSAADALSFGTTNVISALLGGGYINVPKQWEDSTVNLPTISYKTTLISPYGNPMAQLQNIYIPLAMLMSAALPLAVGKQSYTSPFLTSIYHRGKQQIKLGIVNNLSITRGSSNLGYNALNRALALDVSFSVIDLSSVMSVPVSDGGVFGIDMTLDGDHLLNQYLSTLTARDLYSQRYFIPRTKINYAKKSLQLESAMSSAAWGMRLGSMTGGLLSMFAPGSAIITNDNN